MIGDLSQILDVQLTPDGRVDVAALNTILRNMQERVFALEGRTQASQIRNDLEVLGTVTAEGATLTGEVTLGPAATQTPTEVSVDGPLLSDLSGVLPYGLLTVDNLGVTRDLLYPSPFSVLVKDEFLCRSTASNTIGDIGWSVATGTVSPFNATGNHVGAISLDSGAGPAVAPLFLTLTPPSAVRYMSAILALNAATGAGTSIRFGLLRTPTTAGTASRGAYFHSNQIDNFWHTITTDTVGTTDNATTFPVEVEAWVLLEIVLTATTVDFYLNRRRAFRHTTNIEAALCSPAYVAEATGGAAAILNIDTFCMTGTSGEAPKWD